MCWVNPGLEDAAVAAIPLSFVFQEGNDGVIGNVVQEDLVVRHPEVRRHHSQLLAPEVFPITVRPFGETLSKVVLRATLAAFLEDRIPPLSIIPFDHQWKVRVVYALSDELDNAFNILGVTKE